MALPWRQVRAIAAKVRAAKTASKSPGGLAVKRVLELLGTHKYYTSAAEKALKKSSRVARQVNQVVGTGTENFTKWLSSFGKATRKKAGAGYPELTFAHGVVKDPLRAAVQTLGSAVQSGVTHVTERVPQVKNIQRWYAQLAAKRHIRGREYFADLRKSVDKTMEGRYLMPGGPPKNIGLSLTKGTEIGKVGGFNPKLRLQKYLTNKSSCRSRTPRSSSPRRSLRSNDLSLKQLYRTGAEISVRAYPAISQAFARQLISR